MNSDSPEFNTPLDSDFTLCAIEKNSKTKIRIGENFSYFSNIFESAFSTIKHAARLQLYIAWYSIKLKLETYRKLVFRKQIVKIFANFCLT